MGAADADHAGGSRGRRRLAWWIAAAAMVVFGFGLRAAFYHGGYGHPDETITVEVLPGTRMVNGVVATVVHDRVYLNGSLSEDTYDWYAQAAAGGVPSAMYEVAMYLSDGKIVTKDRAKAVEGLKKARGLGYAGAAQMLKIWGEK